MTLMTHPNLPGNHNEKFEKLFEGGIGDWGCSFPRLISRDRGFNGRGGRWFR